MKNLYICIGDSSQRLKSWVFSPVYHKENEPGFYFMTRKENGLFCFSPEAIDIDTLKLCECFIGCAEEDTAFNEAVEVPHDLMVKFNSVYDKKNNYVDVCEILKSLFDVSQEELDEIYEHDPEMVEKVKEVSHFCGVDNLDGYFFRKAREKVKYLLSIWGNDLDRVKNYLKEHGDLDIWRRDMTLVDIFDCEDRRVRSLLYDFHNYWGDDLDKFIEDAVNEYPEENDFDKRYRYVKEKIKNRCKE